MPLISAPRGEAWSGGQYSLWRILLGLYLLVHLARLLPFGAELWSDAGALADARVSPLAGAFPNLLVWFSPPWFVTAWLAMGCVLSLALALGFLDRVAAVGLWYILASLLGRNPLTLDPALPFVGWMLVAHAFVPRAPFLSLAARGRPDPDGGWRLPPAVFLAAWVLMAAGYFHSGLTQLPSPSWLDGSAWAHILQNSLARPTALREWLLALPAGVLRALTWGSLGFLLLFAPLALSSRVRPWLWLAGLLMHFALLVLLDVASPALAMVALHLLTFDPAWLPARRRGEQDIVFYDGSCGLCHRWVRFVLAEDRGGERFLLAPLQGELLAQRLDAEARAKLPDSVVVLTPAGRVLVRSGAVLHILDSLGGLWRIVAWLGRAIPRPLRDGAYDALAAVRFRIFRRPTQACPLLPEHLRERILL